MKGGVEPRTTRDGELEMGVEETPPAFTLFYLPILVVFSRTHVGLCSSLISVILTN